MRHSVWHIINNILHDTLQEFYLNYCLFGFIFSALHQGWKIHQWPTVQCQKLIFISLTVGFDNCWSHILLISCIIFYPCLQIETWAYYIFSINLSTKTKSLTCSVLSNKHVCPYCLPRHACFAIDLRAISFFICR